MEFQFDSLAGFFLMNGHGPYVWASYGVALLVLVTLAVVPLQRQRVLRKEFARQVRQENARRRATNVAHAPQAEPELAD